MKKPEMVFGFSVVVTPMSLGFKTQRDRNEILKLYRRVLRGAGFEFATKKWFGEKDQKLKLVKK